MSRAARRYKRWERDTRAGAWESARELALDLYYCRARAINLYGIGVALEPGEVPYRELWARYWTLGNPTALVDGFGRVQHVASFWRDWGLCPVLLTSHRLLARLAAMAGGSSQIGGRAPEVYRWTCSGTWWLSTTARVTGAARTEALQPRLCRLRLSARYTGWLLW